MLAAVAGDDNRIFDADILVPVAAHDHRVDDEDHLRFDGLTAPGADEVMDAQGHAMIVVVRAFGDQCLSQIRHIAARKAVVLTAVEQDVASLDVEIGGQGARFDQADQHLVIFDNQP